MSSAQNSPDTLQFVTSGPEADLRPLLVRTGMRPINAFTCPPYPKWVKDVNGKPWLVQDEAEEAAMAAAVAKAEADAAAEVAKSGTLKLGK